MRNWGKKAYEDSTIRTNPSGGALTFFQNQIPVSADKPKRLVIELWDMYELHDCILGQTIDMMMINELIEIKSAPCLLDRPMKVLAKEQGSSLEFFST